ncbi:MAG TPA: Sulphatase-modifying factor protein, partial [Gammaproteobacteria bacterium]|nr:Sulphatase-modifying factor protein [Gammaproteobacteria bacterium]
MVVVPAGSFEMGSADDEPDRDDDEGLHLVQLDAFAIGKYE